MLYQRRTSQREHCWTHRWTLSSKPPFLQSAPHHWNTVRQTNNNPLLCSYKLLILTLSVKKEVTPPQHFSLSAGWWTPVFMQLLCWGRENGNASLLPRKRRGEKGKIKLPPNNGVWQEEPPVLPLQYTNLANQTLETIKPRIQLAGGGE